MDIDFQLVCYYCDTPIWASEANQLTKIEFEWTCPNERCAEHNQFLMTSEDL